MRLSSDLSDPFKVVRNPRKASLPSTKEVRTMSNAPGFIRWSLCLSLALAACGNGVQPSTDSGNDAASMDDSSSSLPDATSQPDASVVNDSGVITDTGVATDSGATSNDGGLPRFSFFVTSLRALQALSGSANGFGGDLRFGETGAGAGLRGADKICTQIAERSMPGSGAKVWHAFLSATNDGMGSPVHAINRVGNGPWYDRLGRLFANNRMELINTRPINADPAIINDFPNEDGVPNHAPDIGMGQVDNHDMLTGSNAQGQLYSMTATCLDWTSALGTPATEGRPRVGHSWPRGGGPGGGSGAHWISSLDEAGCRAGVSLIEMGPPIPSNPTVGSGGGYGGFYCFAMEP